MLRHPLLLPSQGGTINCPDRGVACVHQGGECLLDLQLRQVMTRVEQPIYWFNAPSAPCQCVRDWCIPTRENIQSVRRPVSSWEFASRLLLPVSLREFASLAPIYGACLLTGVCRPLPWWVANLRCLARQVVAGIIGPLLPVSLREFAGLTPTHGACLLMGVCRTLPWWVANSRCLAKQVATGIIRR